MAGANCEVCHTAKDGTRSIRIAGGKKRDDEEPQSAPSPQSTAHPGEDDRPLRRNVTAIPSSPCCSWFLLGTCSERYPRHCGLPSVFERVVYAAARVRHNR
jgi:hypothetical protein